MIEKLGVVKLCCVCLLCRDNININDVLGDYALTLVDTLDTLVVRKYVAIPIALLHDVVT